MILLKKRILSFLILTALLFTFSGSAFAKARIPVYKIGSVLYFFDKSTGTVTGFAGDPVDLVFPTVIDGVKVKAIGGGAFAGSKTLRSLSVSDGIETIGDSAFAGCINLTGVEIGQSVKQIGENAFNGCSALSYVYFHSVPISLASTAFVNTAWLNSAGSEFVIGGSVLFAYNGTSEIIYVPDGIKYIMANAFAYNNYIKEVYLPEGLQKIGDNAFLHAQALSAVHFPSSVSDIGAGAFDGTPWLANSKSDFVCVNGILISYKGADSYVSVPRGITAVGSGAFMSHDTLIGVELPESVIYIDSMAFSGCIRLISAIIPSSVIWIDDYAFSMCPNLTIFSDGATYAQNYALLRGISYSHRVYFSYNSTRINFAAAPAVLCDGSTFLPLRETFRLLGYEVLYNTENAIISCTKENTTVALYPSGDIYKNGEPIGVNYTTTYINGCLLIPASVFSAVDSNLKLSWNSQSRTVDISEV